MYIGKYTYAKNPLKEGICSTNFFIFIVNVFVVLFFLLSFELLCKFMPITISKKRTVKYFMGEMRSLIKTGANIELHLPMPFHLMGRQCVFFFGVCTEFVGYYII